MKRKDREKVALGFKIIAIVVALSLIIGIILGSAELIATWGM